MNYLSKIYLAVLIGMILIFLLLSYMTLTALGQNTSLNNYGADKENDTNKDIREFDICAKYDPDKCDLVPQNRPIPKDMIPFQDNTKALSTIKQGKIYT